MSRQLKMLNPATMDREEYEAKCITALFRLRDDPSVIKGYQRTIVNTLPFKDMKEIMLFYLNDGELIDDCEVIQVPGSFYCYYAVKEFVRKLKIPFLPDQ